MNAFQWNDRLCIPPASTASSIASPFVVNLLINNDCEPDKDLWLVAIVARFTLFSFIFDAFYTCLMLREEDVPKYRPVYCRFIISSEYQLPGLVHDSNFIFQDL